MDEKAFDTPGVEIVVQKDSFVEGKKTTLLIHE